MKNKILKYIKSDSIVKYFVIVTILLIFFALLSAFDINIIKNICFVLFGIWSLMFLILSLKLTCKVVGLKITSNERKIITITCIVVFLIYLLIINNTVQIYTWDQRCYYNNQIDLLEKFSNSFSQGIKRIFETTYNENYGYFLLSFTSLIFSLTNKAEYSFIVVYSLVLVIPVVIGLLLNVLNVLKSNKIKNSSSILVIFSTFIISFVLLHIAAIQGQPDIFGIFWFSLIFLLTYNYDFNESDKYRNILIIIFTFLLCITRRWYMFLLISYYICYGLITLIKSYLYKKIEFKKIVKNSFSFLIIALVIDGVLLLPIFLKTIAANYGTNYSAWNLGGMSIQITNQVKYLGIINVILIIVGIIYGLINKRLRFNTIIILGTYIVTFCLFTRIQTMAYHQSLILVFEYMFLILNTLILLSKNKFIKISRVIFSSLFIISFYISISNLDDLFGNKLFSNISIKPVVRNDYNNIGNLVNYLILNTNGEDKIYPNFATAKYCGDTLIYYLMPDKTLYHKVIYESSIDSVHGFPVGLLYSKYVLIANKDLDATGTVKSNLIHKINEAFKDKYVLKKYEKKAEFIINDDITIIIYERIKKVDVKEINYYENLFNEESQKYKDKFYDRLENEKNIIYQK